MDLTSNYKHKESSKAERESMTKALRMAKSYFSRFLLNEKFEDIRFEMMQIDDRLIGDSFKVCCPALFGRLFINWKNYFQVKLSMTNRSHKVYTVEIKMSIRSTSHSGAVTQLVKQEDLVKTIGPRKS